MQGSTYNDMGNCPYQISSDVTGLSSRTKIGKKIVGMCPTCYHLFQFEIEGTDIKITSSEWGTNPVVYPRITIHCKDCGYDGEIPLIDGDFAEVVATLNWIGFKTVSNARQGRIKEGKRVTLMIKFDTHYELPSIPDGWEYSGCFLSAYCSDDEAYSKLLLELRNWCKQLKNRARSRSYK